MSGSEPTEENPAIQGVKDLTDEVRDYLGDGNPMLTGECTVTIALTLTNPVTPALAAKMMSIELAESGSNAFTFEVTDNATGDVFYVRQGVVYTQAELEAQLEELRDEQST
jgi:hypothetical protein